MRHSILRRLAPLLAATALVLAGCVNPFKPSDPEIPTGIAVLEVFKTTDDVLETMRLAIEAKSTNGENAYRHCFSDSVTATDIAFRAIYDQAAKQAWQAGVSISAPEPWNLPEYESKVPRFLYTVRQNAAYSWVWLPDRTSGNDEETGSTALLHRQYLLKATAPNSSTNEIIAQGYCDLSLVFNGSRWLIVRWVDRVDPAVGATPPGSQYSMTWWRLQSLTRLGG